VCPYWLGGYDANAAAAELNRFPRASPGSTTQSWAMPRAATGSMSKYAGFDVWRGDL
jgi:hypothetical protein